MAEQNSTSKPHSKTVLNSDPTGRSFPPVAPSIARSPTSSIATERLLITALPSTPAAQKAAASPPAKADASRVPNNTFSSRITRSAARQIANQPPLSVAGPIPLRPDKTVPTTAVPETTVDSTQHPRPFVQPPPESSQRHRAKRKAEAGPASPPNLQAIAGHSFSANVAKRPRKNGLKFTGSVSQYLSGPAALVQGQKEEPDLTMSSSRSTADNPDTHVKLGTPPIQNDINLKDASMSGLQRPTPKHLTTQPIQEADGFDTAMSGVDDMINDSGYPWYKYTGDGLREEGNNSGEDHSGNEAGRDGNDVNDMVDGEGMDDDKDMDDGEDVDDGEDMDDGGDMDDGDNGDAGHGAENEGSDNDDSDDSENDAEHDDHMHQYSEGTLGDPFEAEFAAPHRGSGLPAALSILGGMLSMSGIGGRLRDILGNLRRNEDPSLQLIALQDLSEILLVSNEDNLIGSFSPDPYVRELLLLMQPNDITGEENPEMMLLACRCLANLMEAIPATAANVVYGGAVPILCQKLLEISFIDLAEQALSTLEKISIEYPSRIVREGGLTACLSFLDFFATSTQRTAVTTAANCCRNIPVDSFPVVRDVMPILLNVLGSSDQRVVEQAALCVSRIIESFKHHPSKLEELVGVELLEAILRLLLPGSSNHFIAPHLHTQFLRVIAITAKESPRLSAELFKMNIVDTLYQNLTGVSPPSGVDDITARLDSVLVMQALIHRPRDQILETLNVICNLLPTEVTALPTASVGDTTTERTRLQAVSEASNLPLAQVISTSNDSRLEFLSNCKEEVRRFTLILLPTLTDAYSSTVNLDVRARVLVAQIKMLSNLDKGIILEALKAVPFASFLASILSQQDHLSLVSYALQATRLLMDRLGDVYRYQLYREGVIGEIEKIAGSPEWNSVPEPVSPIYGDSTRELLRINADTPDHQLLTEAPIVPTNRATGDRLDFVVGQDYDGRKHPRRGHKYADRSSIPGDNHLELETRDNNEDFIEDPVADVMTLHRPHNAGAEIDKDGEIEDDEEDVKSNENNEGRSCEAGQSDGRIDGHGDDMTGSLLSSNGSVLSDAPPPRWQQEANIPTRAQICAIAQRFLAWHETESRNNSMRTEASQTLSSLSLLADEIREFYLGSNLPASIDGGSIIFQKLASFFDSDVFESATSAELLGSGIVHVLEQVLSNSNRHLANAAQSAFLECFMGHPVKSQSKSGSGTAVTPFSILVTKLQDLLSRSEHFEVITVHQNTFDGNHTSAASMLAKQIRLRLVADDDTEVPRAFRSIMVSIHAIATFKTLEDYLRPRISLTERSQLLRRDGLSRALAVMAGSSTIPSDANPAAARLTMRGTHLSSEATLSLLNGDPTNAPGPTGSSSSRSPHQAQDSLRTPSTDNRAQHKFGQTGSNIGQVSTSTPASTLAEVGSDGKPKHWRSRQRANPYKPSTPSHLLESDDAVSGTQEYNEGSRSAGDGGLYLPGSSSVEAVVAGSSEGNSEHDSPTVSLEIVSSARASALKEDSSRISAPSPHHATTTGRTASDLVAAALQASHQKMPNSDAPRPSPDGSSIQSNSQGWHMEFTIDGKPVPLDSTVYRAILDSTNNRDGQLGRSVWSAVYTVHYRRKPGPQPPEAPGFGVPDGPGKSIGHSHSEMISPACQVTLQEDSSLGNVREQSITTSILQLLKNLHDLNTNIDDILVSERDVPRLNAEPLSQFVNTKLTAKLNRQLEEPLIVASNCLPNWSEDLARLYPFLFPFETRHLFLQSTSFGYARSMARWQNAQIQDESRHDRRDDRPFLGRLQRQKVRISRSKILESAVKVMELYGASQSILEVEYFEEVGTGLGPTLEFYSTVSREFSKKKLKLWRDTDLGDGEFISSPNGLFPRPISDEDATGNNGERLLSLFTALGKFVARSMLDSRIIDINFNPIFFRIGEGSSAVQPSLGAVKVVDPALARSLLLIKKFASAKRAIEEDTARPAAEKAADIQALTVNNTHINDLSLDFTLPGYPDIELIPEGRHIGVTMDNVDTYVDKVVAMTLEGGVRRQMDAFRKGFSQVFPYSALSAFTPDELVSLFGRVEEDWSLETLMDSIKADHGFNMDSRSVKNLLQVMSEMTPVERRDFLQFTTGSPRLPIGGFRSLSPMFTVVCKPSEAPYTSDDYLPSVMTCVNYLKLPDYTSIDTLRKQLSTAIKEGQGAFHLS